MAAWITRRISEIWPGNDWAAEHYHPSKLEALEMLASSARSTVSTHAVPIREITEPIGSDEPIYDTGSAVAHILPLVPQGVDERISSKKSAHAGDVVISRLRSYLRQAAVVPEDIKSAQLSTEFIVLRSNDGVDGWWLLPFLLSAPVQVVLHWSQDGNQHPRFHEDVLMRLPVPNAVVKSSARLAEAVKVAVQLDRRASAAIDAAEKLLLSSLGLDALHFSPKLFYTRRYAETLAARRLDAEYFSPRHQRILDQLYKGGQSIGDVAPLTQRKFTAKPGVTFRYIEISGLIGDGQAHGEPVDGADAPSRAQWVVKTGDVITSTVRPIRRLSALIGSDQDGYICSSGFAVLRPIGVEPEVLLTYLRTPIICEILDLNTSASMYPAISEERLAGIPITLPNKSIRSSIVEKVRTSIAAHRDAAKFLEDATREVNALILGAGRV